jgi:hypothetical protein
VSTSPTLTPLHERAAVIASVAATLLSRNIPLATKHCCPFWRGVIASRRYGLGGAASWVDRWRPLSLPK